MKIYDNKLVKCLLWLPALLFFCLVPFVVHYKMYESRLFGFVWAPANEYAVDFFLYYKQVALIAVAGIACLAIFALIYFQKKSERNTISKKQSKMLLPLGIYFLLTLLSSLFSDYKRIAFTGDDGQLESFFAITAYVVCFIYFLILIRTETELKYVERILAVLLVLVSILSLLQITGNDLLRMEWFQRLITPKGYLESGATVTSVFEKNRVSLFAYNPNYAGVLLALLSAGCFGFLITETNKKRMTVEVVLLITLITGLVGTGSKAGLFTFIGVAVLSLLFLRNKIKHFKYILLSCVGAGILGVVLVLTLGANLPLVKDIKALLKFEAQAENPLQEMITEPDKVSFVYNEVPFSVAFEYEDGIFDFSVTSDGEEIPLILSEDKEVYYLQKEGLENVTIHPGLIDDTLPLFAIKLNGREWLFVKLEEESNPYYYLNQYLNLENLQPIERLGFKGHESFATYRGLIWSMTFPILKDTVFLGTGADSFACYYPQSNYKDLYYYTGDATASTRPHSMYLKIAVESGVLALAAILVFFGWYMFQSIRIYWKEDFSSKSACVGFACFLAVAVYLICGLTNDSMVTVAPVFWGILGIGVAANRMTQERSGS